MRPIDKGNIPTIDGLPKTVSDYKDWRQDLIDRIGNCCSYCNMNLNDSPQVEHVVPKALHKDLELEWSNMLLACGPCNRAKSNHNYDSDQHYQPDYHNTHLAFDYAVISHPTKPNTYACIVCPSENEHVNREKAERTIKLLKLDEVISNSRATDLRWKYRHEAFISAQLWRESWDKFGKDHSDHFIPLLKDNVKAKGFFSIWYNVFKDVEAIISELLQVFVGTNKRAFSAKYHPICIHQDDL